MLNYLRVEFRPCLQDRGKISVGARFHLGQTCIQKDRFDQRQGVIQPRGETIGGTYPLVLFCKLKTFKEVSSLISLGRLAQRKEVLLDIFSSPYLTLFLFSLGIS